MLKVFFDKWISDGGWAVIGIDHYLEHEESLGWPEHVGVRMTTLSTEQWFDLEKCWVSNITHWQAGEKSPGTLVIAGQKKS